MHFVSTLLNSLVMVSQIIILAQISITSDRHGGLNSPLHNNTKLVRIVPQTSRVLGFYNCLAKISVNNHWIPEPRSAMSSNPFIWDKSLHEDFLSLWWGGEVEITKPSEYLYTLGMCLLRKVCRLRWLTSRVVSFSWSREAGLVTDPTLFLQNVVKLMRGLLQCMMRQVGGKWWMCLQVIWVVILPFSQQLIFLKHFELSF